MTAVITAKPAVVPPAVLSENDPALQRPPKPKKIEVIRCAPVSTPVLLPLPHTHLHRCRLFERNAKGQSSAVAATAMYTSAYEGDCIGEFGESQGCAMTSPQPDSLRYPCLLHLRIGGLLPLAQFPGPFYYH